MWTLTDLNRRHPALQTGALPTELRPQLKIFSYGNFNKNPLIKMLQQSVKFDYDKRIVIAIESALNALKTRDLAVNDALIVMSEGDK